MEKDFIEQYMEYVGESEAPTLYHRWCCISMLGALVGRNIFISFGHGKIYPNQYIMLMGSPGTRKGTAMGISSRLLKSIGYNKFAPDRVSKERLLMELKASKDKEFNQDDLDLAALTVDSPSELYCVAEEFTDFVGQGNMEFMTMLTKLWDNMSEYTHPKIHGKSIIVEKPTVNLFGGNTAQGLSLAIPPEAMGNGFLSRVIFVFSEPTGIQITWPVPPSETLKASLGEQLKYFQAMKGEIVPSPDANLLLDKMYKGFKGVNDNRFKHYATRRFTHLLKICMLIALSRNRFTIEVIDALDANTLLHYTENRMPKALGEFGRSKYGDVTNMIIEHLAHANKPVGLNELQKLVARDISKSGELVEIMKNLVAAEKAQVITIKTKQGYMIRHVVEETWDSSLLNESFLTEEERSI